MSYLDPKERVIDLELTSYGRHLLAIGKLKPIYYAFFDDDIIYDAGYASVDEAQDNVEPRIQENTPRMAAQGIFSSRETAVFEATPNVVNDLIIGQEIENLKEKDKQLLLTKTRIQEGPEQNEILQLPLGMSNPAYQTAPAWNARFLKAPLSASVDYLEVSGARGTYYRDIPQLSTDIQYHIEKNKSGWVTKEAPVDGNNVSSILKEETIYFDDGAMIEFKRDTLIIRLEESNVFFQKDNFEVECFEVETVDGVEYLNPLRFYTDIDQLMKDDLGAGYEAGTVQRYFDFFIDGEIPPEEICPLIKEDTTKQFYQSKIFECDDIVADEAPEDIYDDSENLRDLC